MQTNSKAFTLIELLVVVAIVTILMAFLLPALKKGRETAQWVGCMSNERQIGVAFASYLMDNRQVYPYANPATTYTSWPAAGNRPWMIRVAPYLGNYTVNMKPAVLLCQRNEWPAASQNNQCQPPTTYGFGAAFPSNWHDSSGVNPATDPAHYIAAQVSHRLLNPARTMFLGEVPNSAPASNPWNRWFNEVNVSFVPFWPGYSSYWLTDEIAARPGGNPIVRVNHSRAWNALMADGSVRATTRTQLELLAYDGYVGRTRTDGTYYWWNR